MTLQKEADEFLKDRGVVEPIALQCNDCESWSAYRVENNTTLPRGWREDEKGYHCNDCRKHIRRK